MSRRPKPAWYVMASFEKSKEELPQQMFYELCYGVCSLAKAFYAVSTATTQSYIEYTSH